MAGNIQSLVGHKAPPFQMDSTDGTKRLESYHGKPLLLAFFPLAFTGG